MGNQKLLAAVKDRDVDLIASLLLAKADANFADPEVHDTYAAEKNR